jgi:hypothetical protein
VEYSSWQVSPPSSALLPEVLSNEQNLTEVVVHAMHCCKISQDYEASAA